jgi:hypothetical protein
MHPDDARYACTACAVELSIHQQGYEENLDGGPSALTIQLSCPSCGQSSVARWLMRLVMTASGVGCEPELIQLSDTARLEHTRTFP